jgi:hypothetical protein
MKEPIMPFNLDIAIQHLQTHALPPYGTGRCATHVREALEAGGLTIPRSGSGAAKDYGPRLIAAGFIAGPDRMPYRKGDIALIDGFSKNPEKGIERDYPHGHLAMFDGTQWISDFRQIGLKPYPGSNYVKAAPLIRIYRLP